jgi:hypothetical protein
MPTTIRFVRGGGVRKLFEPWDRTAFGAIPRRASRVEVVEEGPQKGKFFVEMSPLGPNFQFCLTETFDDYADAVRAEQGWLTQHWIQGET